MGDVETLEARHRRRTLGWLRQDSRSLLYHESRWLLGRFALFLPWESSVIATSMDEVRRIADVSESGSPGGIFAGVMLENGGQRGGGLVFLVKGFIGGRQREGCVFVRADANSLGLWLGRGVSLVHDGISATRKNRD